MDSVWTWKLVGVMCQRIKDTEEAAQRPAEEPAELPAVERSGQPAAGPPERGHFQVRWLRQYRIWGPLSLANSLQNNLQTETIF